jgi:hypothetical protein
MMSTMPSRVIVGSEVELLTALVAVVTSGCRPVAMASWLEVAPAAFITVA